MQIVGYEPTVEGPVALRIAADGAVEREALAPGTELSYALGERHCAGAVTDDGHVACDAEASPYCPAHTSRWPCARCAGDCDRPVEACHEEHAIYLAAFAPATFKVGVTRSWRLRTRLREQGADRAVRLRTVADGRRARRVEADLAARDDLVDRVRVAEKVAGLHRAVDADAWERLLADFDAAERVDLEYDLDLAAGAVPATLAAGTVRGALGRVLALDRAGTTYAVDLRDLVGYDLADGRPGRDLQAGLGAFD